MQCLLSKFNSLTFIRHLKVESNCKSFNNVISKQRNFKKSYSTESENQLSQNLNIKNAKDFEKDKLLFRHENTHYFKMLNFFSFSQFMFWTYLGITVFTTMKSVKVAIDANQTTKKTPWWQVIDFGKYKNGITIGSFIIGWGTLAGSWIYCLHSVKYLVLRKGRTNLTFVTYTPIWSKPRHVNVHLNDVSAKSSRLSSTSHLAIKVKGHYFHYLLDMKGEFVNPKLFDSTAGLQRKF